MLVGHEAFLFGEPQIGIHHHADERVKSDSGLPAERGARFGGIAEEAIGLRGTEIIWIYLDNAIEQAERAHCIGVRSVLRIFEGNFHVRLRTEVVNLIGTGNFDRTAQSG